MQHCIGLAVHFRLKFIEQMISLELAHLKSMTLEVNKWKKSERRILEFCVTPKSILEITELLGLKEKKSARRHIKPLVEQGRLAMTLPDKPNSKNQKYVTIK